VSVFTGLLCASGGRTLIWFKFTISILPKFPYRFKVIPIEIPVGLLPVEFYVDSKIYMEMQRSRIAKTILKKKNKTEEFILLDFMTDCITYQ